MHQRHHHPTSPNLVPLQILQRPIVKWWNCTSRKQFVHLAIKRWISLVSAWKTSIQLVAGATKKMLDEKSVPIQPGGTLPDGSTFTNVIELKKVLLTYEDKLAKELLESLLAYALGRTVEFSDADDVESLRLN